MKCILHLSNDLKRNAIPVTPFSAESWEKVAPCAKEWAKYDGEVKEKKEKAALWDSPPRESTDIGYHRVCYSRFTDMNKLKRAESQQQKRHHEANVNEQNASVATAIALPPTKVLRSSSLYHSSHC